MINSKTMKYKYKKTLRDINNSLSTEEKLCNFMLDRVYGCILRGKTGQANIIIKAIKASFPKTRDVVIADTVFNALWKLGKHEQAVKVYVKAGRPFWFSETVGQYYERNGQVAKAMKEYDFLIDEYLKMKLLPLPGGPVELYKLGKWHIKKEPYKARKLLRMYLRAEKEDCGAGFGIRYKKQALRLLTN